MRTEKNRFIRMFEHLPLGAGRPWIGYGVAMLAVLLAIGLRFALDGAIPSGYPFLTFFPAVILTAFFFGRRSGILTALLGGLAAWYLFIEPGGAFVLNRSILVALLFYLFIVAVDIFLVDLAQVAGARLIAERERNRALAETRALLFDELQHRVSNNLQVIGALLSAQKRRVSDETARHAIEEAANRLTVVGRISRTLYRADGEQADMAEFLERLAEAVLGANGRTDVSCSFDIAPGLTVDAGRAVPLALVFTEALTNALEHGLPGRAGTIRVAMRHSGSGRICLSIDDDGSGVGPGFSLEDSNSLGLSIARQLARQLGGEFTLSPRQPGPGTSARLDITA